MNTLVKKSLNRAHAALVALVVAVLMPSTAVAGVGGSTSVSNNDLTKAAGNAEGLTVSLGAKVLGIGVLIAVFAAAWTRSFRTMGTIFAIAVVASMALDGGFVDAADSVAKALRP